MQHNTWSKDRNDLSSLVGKVITEGYEHEEDLDLEYLEVHGELPESQADLDRFKASKSKSEDGENPEIFQLIASVGELDAVDMSEFLYGLAQIFDDPDVEDPAFEETRQHIEAAYKSFEGRMGN